VQVKDLKDKRDYHINQKKKDIKEQEQEEDNKQNKIKQFYDKTIGESQDLNDQL